MPSLSRDYTEPSTLSSLMTNCRLLPSRRKGTVYLLESVQSWISFSLLVYFTFILYFYVHITSQRFGHTFYCNVFFYYLMYCVHSRKYWMYVKDKTYNYCHYAFHIKSGNIKVILLLFLYLILCVYNSHENKRNVNNFYDVYINIYIYSSCDCSKTAREA